MALDQVQMDQIRPGLTLGETSTSSSAAGGDGGGDDNVVQTGLTPGLDVIVIGGRKVDQTYHSWHVVWGIIRICTAQSQCYGFYRRWESQAVIVFFPV